VSSVPTGGSDEGGELAVDILIAEDEPSILESLDFILRRAGWSIASVTDGDAVLGALRRDRPKVLVLDVMLPRRSGFDVLKQVRADDVLRDMPVLILTAKGQAQDRRVAWVPMPSSPSPTPMPKWSTKCGG
jgi:two-component system, OmpR family, response regulator